MAKRTHSCDITLNATRASVFEVADNGTVRYEVELCTDSTKSGQVARFDFHDVCETTAGVIEHLRRGYSLESFIAAHCHEPGDTPEITGPQHDHELTR